MPSDSQKTSEPNRLFPILFSGHAEKDAHEVRRGGVCLMVVGLPWAMLREHEKQCLRNHDQNVSMLASRGGLSACEAVAVLEDRQWSKMEEAQAHTRLDQLLTAWSIDRVKS